MVEQGTEKLSPDTLINRFIESRRDGLSSRTIQNYRLYLRLAGDVVVIHVSGQDIQRFVAARRCTNGGKHAYFQCLRAFYNWLYSAKASLDLNTQDNPISIVEAPKVQNKILPSLTLEQLEYVIDQARYIRDKAVISLFADSGLRLVGLAIIELRNVDWEHRLIKVRCKGNKEGLAPFGERTESLLREWLSKHNGNGRLWDINQNGISIMLRRLMRKTGLLCNPHFQADVCFDSGETWHRFTSHNEARQMGINGYGRTIYAVN